MAGCVDRWLEFLAWRLPGCNFIVAVAGYGRLPPDDIPDVAERLRARVDGGLSVQPPMSWPLVFRRVPF